MHFERSGDYFENGQILESKRAMGTGKAARQRRIVYQYSFKRAKRDNRTTNLMIDKAERIADGKVPLKKAQIPQGHRPPKALDQAPSTAPASSPARRLAGLKGYVTNLPEAKMPGAAVITAYHERSRDITSMIITPTSGRPRPHSA